MAAPKRPASIGAEFREIISAPIIYLMSRSADGNANGAIQIELASLIRGSRPDGTVGSEFLQLAVCAAAQLRRTTFGMRLQRP